MLAALERANLFVVPLDDRGEWYRYHHLFADVLKVRLLARGVAHVNALHTRASDWFERHGSPEEAVRHALAGSDFPRAARLIESTIPSVRRSRQDATLLGWLALLPPSAIEARPVLRVFAAWASLVAGDLAAVEPQLAAAEGSSQSAQEGRPHASEPGEELDSLPVTIALYRGALAMAAGDTTAIGIHAQHALDVAASDDYLGRGAAAGMLGLAAWAGGDLEAGTLPSASRRRNLRLRATFSMPSAPRWSSRTCCSRSAGSPKRNRATSWRSREADGAPPAADLHAGISEVLRQRNDLDAAAEHLAAAEALGAGAFSHEHRYRWAVGMAGLAQSAGDLDAALDLLGRRPTRNTGGDSFPRRVRSAA